MKNVGNVTLDNSKIIKSKVRLYHNIPLYHKNSYYILTQGGGIYYEPYNYGNTTKFSINRSQIS